MPEVKLTERREEQKKRGKGRVKVREECRQRKTKR